MIWYAIKVSIDLAIDEPSICIFSRENKVFVEKVSNSEFGMRVYKERIEARNESISLYAFLRISPRKIYILKKTKLGPRELNELDDMTVKKMLVNLTNDLKSTTKMPKKWKKNKSVQNFFILKYIIEHFKTSNSYY